MSHVNIIQGLFTLAVLGDGEWTQANALKPGSLWICPECKHVSVHCQCTALGCLWPTATKNPYQSVQFLLSSFHLWASQKRKVWHTHCSSSQHHNGSSFWLEDWCWILLISIRVSKRLHALKEEEGSASVWRSWHTCRFVRQPLWTELGHSQDAEQISFLQLTAARDGWPLFPLPSAPAGLETS